MDRGIDEVLDGLVEFDGSDGSVSLIATAWASGSPLYARTNWLTSQLKAVLLEDHSSGQRKGDGFARVDRWAAKEDPVRRGCCWDRSGR